MQTRRILLLTTVGIVILTMGVGPVFAWHISNTTTGYMNSGGTFVATTTIPFGENAVDSATVDPVVGCSGTACGHVAFALYNNGDCSGTPVSGGQVAVTAPIASGNSETVYSKGFAVTPGSWSFRDVWVFYDGSISAVTYPCEPFNVPSPAPEFPLGMAALMLLAVPALLYLRKTRLTVSP